MRSSGQCEGIVLKQRKEKQIQLVRGESLQAGEMEWNREMESTEGVTETSALLIKATLGTHPSLLRSR